VFASTRGSDGKILKCRKDSNPAKFGNTPDRCFIANEDINGLKCPEYLDKAWYINLALKRLEDFGVMV
jgi:DNA polymerase